MAMWQAFACSAKCLWKKLKRVLTRLSKLDIVHLCKILLKHFWKISPSLEETKENYLHCIKGTTAGVVIGDRALAQRKISPYIYDLAGAWKAMTGLPFVFAAWIANKKLPEDFIQQFNEANAIGLKNIDKVIEENWHDVYDLKKYYTENISYTLDKEKLKGMKKFLEMLSA